jgi:hypothetical protein
MPLGWPRARSKGADVAVGWERRPPPGRPWASSRGAEPAVGEERVHLAGPAAGDERRSRQPRAPQAIPAVDEEQRPRGRPGRGGTGPARSRPWRPARPRAGSRHMDDGARRGCVPRSGGSTVSGSPDGVRAGLRPAASGTAGACAGEPRGPQCRGTPAPAATFTPAPHPPLSEWCGMRIFLK